MTTIRAKFRPSRSVMARAAPADPVQPSAPRRGARTERLARQLALAHLIERKIDSGEVRSYGEMARALGLTQPRITQVMHLLLLSPTIQQRVLLGEATLGIRAAMRLSGMVEWREQGERV